MVECHICILGSEFSIVGLVVGIVHLALYIIYIVPVRVIVIVIVIIKLGTVGHQRKGLQGILHLGAQRICLLHKVHQGCYICFAGSCSIYSIYIANYFIGKGRVFLGLCIAL